MFLLYLAFIYLKKRNIMQKITLFLLLLISSNLFAQEESFPYHLEYWKPMGMEIAKAFPMDEGYLLFGRVSDYSPEAYPGLITDTQTQQNMLGESFQMTFVTDTDFNVTHSNILPLNFSIPDYRTAFKGSDQSIYVYSNNSITKIGGDGNWLYTQTTEGYHIESLTYHNNVLYGLIHYENASSTYPGLIVTFNANNGNILDEYSIADPTAAGIEYLGIAVDDSGIYVMGTAVYNEDVTGYPPNYNFYYTEGAFQPFQQINVNPSFSSNVGFLTKYELNNPEQMQWSTYLGGQGHIFEPGSDSRNHLQLINGDLYVCYNAFNSTNISTQGAYLPFVTNGTGSFLMRFSATGERLMGTYLHEITDGSFLTPHWFFVQGVDEIDKIVLLSTRNNLNSDISPNAPYTEANYHSIIISEFTPTGERVYATLISDNNDMGRTSPNDVNVIVSDEGFKVFCWETAPGLAANYLTSEDKLLDYAVENVYSIASYNDKPSSSDKFIETTFSIYPNPTTGVLNITSSSSEKITQAKVYDISGKLLLHLTFDNHQAQQQIAVEHLASGMYIIELSSEKHTKKTKFIKR